MQQLPSDLLGVVSGYLPPINNLSFSISAKLFTKKDRQLWQSYCSARKLQPVIIGKLNPLFYEDETIVSKMEYFNYIIDKEKSIPGLGVKEGFYCLKIMSDAFLATNNCHIYRDNPYALYNSNKRPFFISKTFCYSPRYEYTTGGYCPSRIACNIKVCMIHRCRLAGRVRREIIKSPTLRALVG